MKAAWAFLDATKNGADGTLTDKQQQLVYEIRAKCYDLWADMMHSRPIVDILHSPSHRQQMREQEQRLRCFGVDTPESPLKDIAK